MTAALMTLAFASLLANPLEDSPGVELRYTGALSKAGRDADTAAVKRFTLYSLVIREPADGRRMVSVLNERGAGGWSWPERLQVLPIDPQGLPAPGMGLRLLYDYEGNPLAIPLLSPVTPYAAQLKAGAKWTEGRETWEVTGRQKVQDRDCWQVLVTTGIGRKRLLSIEVGTPVVVALEERVFVGQGDEHTLSMQLEAVRPLNAEQLASDTRPLEGLMKLQSDLARRENEFRPELSDAQLKLVSEALPNLQRDSADTPFSALVSAITKDLKGQLQRTDEVTRLAERFVGKPAPSFTLSLTDKSQISAEGFKDKITVLHFWEYQNEPLVEPYGQVGYLDFLYGKRRKLGVQVYGVAVDGRLGDTQSSASAVKSILNLRDFMRLSYPIALDEGKLLTKFGEPTKFGAKLPLWIVIRPDGRIAHFRTGFYKIDPDEGLRELDDVLVKLIRAQKGTTEQK